MTVKKLTPTLENYLVTIYKLSKKNGFTRISEVANFKKVSYPSVTTAVRKLTKLGYVEHERYGFIKLTNKGRRIAITIHNGELRVKYFFMYVIGFPESRAQQVAKLMIYGLDNETRKQLRRFYALMIDFDESKAKKLVEFLKEQRKKLGVKEVPKEALKLKLRLKEDN
ncbi:DNA-binding protein [Thermosipho melanesiensis]|uniref:Iron dependent repressor n=2 Tax=Thermosipho melanesiensis TaxID=46541 RepID=A6LJD2_THEM4|nr:metal-dependent transcriptional regulator [Thermosipho melanesiensis]ABR30033.1 iron dependent repressor [Thermosipho melanesiensis BI429]APT73234.1 DNA-binding protein [Thermosipho melanesiensis]OOC38627.1 DNA-binding protein [Thermosipho melanesiensis]OOC40431.1 DNA-binding protein [Thermosipho melanesiensis]OOC40696.1 DNA-binding protein [Thermosipho melanesiensis]